MTAVPIEGLKIILQLNFKNSENLRPDYRKISVILLKITAIGTYYPVMYKRL